MKIRQEQLNDYEAVYKVVQAAFANAEHADGNEQDLVAALRKSAAYIPELSLVAEEQGKIIGHIMFTKAFVGSAAVLALAPLSVLPEYQRQGAGSALVEAGHEVARRLGYGYSVVLGSEKYYPRFGYVPAESFKIFPPFTVPRENFMAYKLNSTAINLDGKLCYAKEFGIEE